MSRSKGRSSMKPATLRSWFTWWFVLVFPMCPMEVDIHVLAFITIADVLLMCGGFPPALPTSYYAIARNVLMSATNCLRRWCQCSVMMACFTRLQIFWVRHIGSGHLWHVGVFHYAKILPRCVGCYISGSDLNDALIEAEVFGKRTLISILTGSHY